MNLLKGITAGIFLAIFLAQAPHVYAFAKKSAPQVPEKPAKKYTCSMFCQLSEKPGKCPKCGMEMWEVSQA